MKKYIYLGLLLVGYAQAASITFLIDEPDMYNFGANMMADPTDPGDAIITVSTNDVIVDLGGIYVRTDPANTTTGIIGIKIEDHVENVLIKNGNIFGLSGPGVYVGNGCSNIRMDGVHITNCSGAGIQIEGGVVGTSALHIANANITNTKPTATSPAIGISAKNSSSFLLEGLRILKNDGGVVQSGFGLFIEDCSTLAIQDCIVSGNAGLNESAGVYVQSSTNVYIRDTVANLNFIRGNSPASYTAGVILQNSSECRVEECEVTLNQSPFAAGYGVALRNTFETLLMNLRVEQTKGATIASGIELEDATRCKINKCLVYSGDGATVYGIRLKGSNNDHCELIGNDVSNNRGSVTSYGIIDERNNSTSLIIRNKAFNHDDNYNVDYPGTISLPVTLGSLSNSLIGLPGSATGLLDNISINP